MVQGRSGRWLGDGGLRHAAGIDDATRQARSLAHAAVAEPPGRIVILEFPDRAAALAWRSSPAYQAILPIRDATSTSRVYVVDGYGG